MAIESVALPKLSLDTAPEGPFYIPATGPASRPRRTLKHGDTTIPYVIVRSRRRFRTMQISVNREDGQVTVRVKVPIAAEGPVRSFTGQGATEALAVKQVVDQIKGAKLN